MVVETNGTDTIWYYYDATGSLTGFELNGTAYFYVKNMQGDIVAITDASGTKVVEYLYDSWGKLISTTGSLASTVGAKNPYRYRGYRYDAETGLYYLQSRYYDPEIGRFICSDSLSMIGANRDFASLNLFAYCGNNSNSRKDIGGYAWETIFDIVSLATSVAEVIARPADPWAWAGLIGDVVDVVVPFVGGLGESVDVAKTMFRVVDKGDDIVSAAQDMRRAAKATDDIKSSTGAYVILYEGGQHYIGKGGFGRAITSATQHSSSNSKVASIIWAPTPSRRSAFVTEFLLQSTFGLNKKYEKSFNLIWSPGKTILKTILREIQ